MKLEDWIRHASKNYSSQQCLAQKLGWRLANNAWITILANGAKNNLMLQEKFSQIQCRRIKKHCSEGYKFVRLRGKMKWRACNDINQKLIWHVLGDTYFDEIF